MSGTTGAKGLHAWIARGAEIAAAEEHERA